MQRNNHLSRTVLVLLLVISCFLTISCGPSGKIFIKEDQLTEEYDHIANIDVHRRGFWFLWIIPFKIGSEGAAQSIMEDETLTAFPEAEGVVNYKVIEDYGPWFWVSGTRITGKIVRKK